MCVCTHNGRTAHPCGIPYASSPTVRRMVRRRPRPSSRVSETLRLILPSSVRAIRIPYRRPKIRAIIPPPPDTYTRARLHDRRVFIAVYATRDGKTACAPSRFEPKMFFVFAKCRRVMNRPSSNVRWKYREFFFFLHVNKRFYF